MRSRGGHTAQQHFDPSLGASAPENYERFFVPAIGRPLANEILADAMGRHIGPQAAGFVRAVFALSEEPELEALLKDARFRHVNVQAEPRDLSLPAPRDFLWQYVGSTPLAAVVAEADDEARSALGREVIAGWQDFRSGDRMNCQQRVVVATARR